MNVLQKQEINLKIAAILHPDGTAHAPESVPDCGVVIDDVYYNWMKDHQDWATLLTANPMSFQTFVGKGFTYAAEIDGKLFASQCPFEAVCMAFLGGSE